MKVDKAKIIIVMGSVEVENNIGKALQRTSTIFLEGDAFHSNQNIKKMSLGKPLRIVTGFHGFKH